MKKTTLWLGALAMAGALLAAPTPAEARIVEIAKVESIGGHTRYNDTIQFWADVRGPRIVRGYAVVTRRFRSQNGAVLRMTDGLDARETYSIWMQAYRARPWTAPVVRQHQVNVDASDTKVTYMRRYTQLIRGSLPTPPPPLPFITRDMQGFVNNAWTMASKIADSDLMTYTAGGGWFGFRRETRLSQSGLLRDSVTYGRPPQGAHPYRKSGWVTPTDIMTLRRLIAVARWTTLTDFAGQPSATDGIDEGATVWTWGQPHSVFGGYSWNRTPEYQAVLDEVKSLADQIPTPRPRPTAATATAAPVTRTR